MKLLPILFLLVLLFLSSQASQTGSPCIVDDDCPHLHSCTGTTTRTCVHKPLFPITVREVFGTIFILILNALLTAGGIGGGAAYVPYVMLLFSTTLSRAINIAYLCVFGGGLGNLASVITLRNPKTKRFLTNYNLNMIILPALMVGIMIGIILQRIFAPVVTYIILSMVLGYSLYKNYYKLKANLAKERKARQQAQEILKTEVTALKTEEMEANTLPSEPNEGRQVETPKNLASKNPQESTTPNPKILQMVKISNQVKPVKQVEIGATKEVKTAEDPFLEQRERLYKKETQFPFLKVGVILLNVVVIVVVGVIRGSKVFKPVVGVQWSCGWDFTWFAIAIVLYSGVLALSVYLVNRWQKEKQRVGYEFLPEEPRIESKVVVKLVIISTLSGLIGAIVALGGALIIAPALLELGLPPAVTAATSSIFMIFAMFNTALSAILNEKVTDQELAWFIPLAFVFSFASSKLVNWYVRKTGKQSTIIKCIMLVVTLGILCLLAVFIRDMVVNTKPQITFASVC